LKINPKYLKISPFFELLFHCIQLHENAVTNGTFGGSRVVDLSQIDSKLGLSDSDSD